MFCICVRQTLHCAIFVIYLLVTDVYIKEARGLAAHRTVSHVSRNYISGNWQNLFAASKREKL